MPTSPRLRIDPAPRARASAEKIRRIVEGGEDLTEWEDYNWLMGEVLLVEGIHGLNDRLTSSVPRARICRIFISALSQLALDDHNRLFTSEARLVRRIVRDHLFRGFNAERTLDMWERVRRGEGRWIFPFQEDADVMFNSALVYEPAVLKVFAERYLEGVSAEPYSTLGEKLDIEVELGFTAEQTLLEVERCLNCDIQTVFAAPLCIECDACIDICPVNCLTITANGDEADLRKRLSAPAENAEQALYVSADLPQTGRVMVKDEDLCVHCGLCAERCPTGAWDMQKSTVLIPYAQDEAADDRAREAPAA